MRYLLTSLLCVLTLSLTAQEAGCTYQQADNYSSTATIDNGSCIFFTITQDDCNNTYDGNDDGNVSISDFLELLSLFGDTDVDADGVWDSLDDCLDLAACNYFADPSEFCQYLDVIGVCGGDCWLDDDSDLICDDVDECVGYYDECEVCNGSGIPEGYCDCFGSMLDECGTCDDDPSNDCVQDCNEVWGGTAVLDECDTCDSDPTNDCVQDCNQEWGGTAELDECSTCDSDPSNDCEQDCNGDWGGIAALDECGVCDEDVTNDCVQDCNEEWGGTALLDECEVCDSDPSNDCVQDCNGVWGGTSVLDECGVCDGPGPTEIVIESITILYDSLYAEQIDEWWVYEVGADTVFNYTCAPNCGDAISHEGYDYSTVQIGDQCWFSENCRYLPEVSVSSSTEESTTEPYYYVVDYEGTDIEAAMVTDNYETYGVLYNWPAVMTEGMCPSGWHIPSNEDWAQLTDFLGESVGTPWGIETMTAGGKMKEAGYDHWNSPNTGATNSSGFTGLPGGLRSYGGSLYVGAKGYWWSSSEFFLEPGSTYAFTWCLSLSSDNDSAHFYDVGDGWAGYSNGFSARCIRCEADEDGDGVCDTTDECIDNTACNYEAVPSEPCEYTSCAGCIDSSFCNYDSTATIDDGSCEGDSDGDGICDSQDSCDGVEDECGVCNGPGPTELVIDTITLLYDSIYSEAISEWWVFETGADTTYTYECGYICDHSFGTSMGPGGFNVSDCVGEVHLNYTFSYGEDEPWSTITNLFDIAIPVADGELYEGTSFSLEGDLFNQAVLFLTNGVNDPMSQSLSYLAEGDVCGGGSGSGTSESYLLFDGAGIDFAGEDIIDISLTLDIIDLDFNGGWIDFYISSTFSISTRCDCDGNVVDECGVCGGDGSSCFEPAEFSECGDDIGHEGYDYSTVQIGELCWFSENCRYLPIVSPSSEENDTEPYYYVYDYEGTDVAAAKATANYETYGVLYNWPAVMTEDICPSGWHIPSSIAFDELSNYLGGEDVPSGWEGGGAAAVADALRSNSGWDNNGNGSNSSGFTGLPGGGLAGSFNGNGSWGYWWSSTLPQALFPWYFHLGSNNIYWFQDPSRWAMSARCIKD
ncbi:hypothetical protein N9C00_02130 [Flavobacteriales bacterium]|nr:hypothetical protein [Flavobacteriales bacterium]